MNVNAVKKSLKILKSEQAKIAKSRDTLREAQDELEAQLESGNDALDSLNYAIERLSELV